MKKCETCGAAIVRKRFSTGRLEDNGCHKRRRFCSRQCAWAGQLKESPTRSAIQKRIAAHRKSACERCGSTKRLCVHHKDGDWKNNQAANLQTLCSSCHTSLHHARGEIVTKKKRLPCILCARLSVRQGLCATHLTRLKRYGDPRLVKRQVGGSWQLCLDDGGPSGPE